MTFSDPSPSPVPQHLSAVAREFQSINRVSAWAPFTWMRKGFADLFIAQFNSLFYGVAFALIGWTIAFFYGASYGLTLTASSAFMLIAPVLALGLYALSHQIEQGETPRLRTTLTVWRGNMANIALYALVTGVVGLIWARAAVVIFAVFYNTGLPSAGEFVTAIMRLDNIEFVVAYFGVGALFATFVFAISVVAIPLMYDRKTDAITAMLLSLRCRRTQSGRHGGLGVVAGRPGVAGICYRLSGPGVHRAHRRPCHLARLPGPDSSPGRLNPPNTEPSRP